MKILVTGAKGQLGIDLCASLTKNDKNTVKEFDCDSLDICNIDDVMQMVHDIKPNIIINAAAYTNVDGCESDTDIAHKVNAFGARNLAVAAQETNAKIVHISTDFVFSGIEADGTNRTSPYTEFDTPNPLSVYGKSKLAGENLVRDLCSKFFIIRTSWLYGINGNNFVKTMLKLSEKQDKIQVVDDQVGTPTYTMDLVEVIEMLMKTDAYGLYHCSNEGNCSWYEFAKRIFETVGKQVNIEPITTEQLKRPAKRPSYSVMDKMGLRLSFDKRIKNWESSLEQFIQVNSI